MQVTMQAWQVEPQNASPQTRAWSAPSQPQPHWESQQAALHQASQIVDGSRIMAWPPVHHAEGAQQSDAVPSAVQQRAAQYAGDEGLARPPTRPPSDWRSRQAQSHGDEAVVSHSNRDALSSDRCLLLRNSPDCSDKHMLIGRQRPASCSILSFRCCGMHSKCHAKCSPHTHTQLLVSRCLSCSALYGLMSMQTMHSG